MILEGAGHVPKVYKMLFLKFSLYRLKTMTLPFRWSNDNYDCRQEDGSKILTASASEFL